MNEIEVAVHLAEAMVHGVTEFVTIDKELTNRINRQRLAELGLHIVDSGEV